MTKKTNFFKIGMFVLAGMSILVAMIIFLGARSMFQKKYIIETYFDESVHGLDIGSPVKFRGVAIGNVTEITFVQDKYPLKPNDKNFAQARYVLVRIALKDLFNLKDSKASKAKLTGMIQQGLRVRITTKGLTGQAYLELDYVDPKEDKELKFSWQPEVFYLPSTRSTFTKIGASIDEFVKKLDKSNIQAMLLHIDKLIVTLTDSIKDMRVSNISKDASLLLIEIRGTNRELRKLLASKDLQKAPKQLHQSLENISKATGKLNAILARNNYDISTTMENLRVVTEDMKEITGNAKKYPSLIFFGDPPNKTIVEK